jgi:hypothetical protein
MTKNLTRRGLAFGAIVALASSVVAGAPANAAGVDATATLLPLTGYSEAYAVPAGAASVFSLKYTTTNTAGATIKFVVTDASSRIEPTVGNKAILRTGYELLSTTSTDTATVTDGVVTVTLNNSRVVDADFKTGIVLNLEAGDITSSGVAPLGRYVVRSVATNSASFTMSALADSGALVPTGTLTVVTARPLEVLREARADDGSYVVRSTKITSTTASDRTANIVFGSLDADATRSATIQGFTDDANLLNDVVDSSESLTPARTIQFVKISEITATTVLTAPLVGAATLGATVTTSPVLNGEQIVNTGDNFIRVAFTRQDSTVTGASAAATQSATTGDWTTTVPMVDASGGVFPYTSSTGVIGGGADWGFTSAATPIKGDTDVASIAVSAAKVGTIVTAAAHNLRSGDKVTVTNAGADSPVATSTETAAVVTVTSATSFTYPLTETVAVTAAARVLADTIDAGTGYDVVTYTGGPVSLVDAVFAGTHSARALIETGTATNSWTLTGSASTLGTLTATSADIKFTTVGTETLQGSSTIADDDTTDAKVKVGTLSATVTASVLDEDGDSVGAGRSVAFTVARSNSTIKVNGKTASGTVITDVNGQATFTVTDTLGLAGSKVTINAVAEGVAAAASDVTLEWFAQAFGLVDLNTTDASLGTSRTVLKGASYDLALLVADQFNATPAADTYRVLVSGSGVTEGIVPLTAGMATVKISDNGVSTSIASNLQLQKKNATTGVFANEGAVVTLTTTTTEKGALTLGADGTSLYKSPATVDLSDAVAKKAIVERDTRTSFVAQPVYANSNLVAGKATNSSTGANLGSSVVTVSGPSSILFVNGAVEKRGAITLVSDGNGEFAVEMFSTTAQTDTVITVTANGVSKTVKVSFTGIGVGEGTSLVVTMPAAVKPASTFQVKAKLADAFGNGVTASAGRVKVTYTGAGIVFGTLPTSTDANGDLMFSVLLGSNDTGSVNVTVSYDQNGDGDYVDTKDLVTAGTTAITASGKVAASSDTIVNVGTFSGKLVVYALNAAGSEVSYKIAGKWVTQVVTSDLLMRYDRVVGATGKTIKVDIYVDGVLKLAKSVVTK